MNHEAVAAFQTRQNAEVTFFSKLLEQGHKGEALVASLFQSIGYDVQDVSGDSSYFAKDIDLIVTKGEESLRLEVKADSKMAATGNVCIETIGNIAANKKGWIYYTEATHICFVDMVNCIIYIVRTSELLELLRQNKCAKLIRSQLEDGEYYKEAELALVSLNDLRQCKYYNEFQLAR